MVEWLPFGELAQTAEYELYDYETDPLETRNLATEFPEVVDELKQILDRYAAPVPRK
jgi:iduronate 2-sulfatase